jgi:F-type H+-transporting ATPase subunit b
MIDVTQGIILLLNAAPEPRLFGMDQQTFLAIVPHLFNFILLAVLLTFILYKPVRAFLHERADSIARELDEAEAARTAALALKDQYEHRLKTIEMERTVILEDARKLAIERRNRDMAETKKEIDALKMRAGQEIAAERDRIQDQVEQAIVEISCEIAGKLLTANVDPAVHKRLFDEALAELDETVFKPAVMA